MVKYPSDFACEHEWERIALQKRNDREKALAKFADWRAKSLPLEANNHIDCHTTNPFNTISTSSGSSGGESVLTACHDSPLGVGTDIGGSIRVPAAAHCGLPHVGLLGSHDGVTDYMSSNKLEEWCEHSPQLGINRQNGKGDGGLFKKFQQVDSRWSTVNNIRRDQINIIVNYPTGYFDEADNDITLPENQDIDPELNKYPPLVEFGLKVVMSTTNLVTTNIATATFYNAEIPQIWNSNIESITLKRTSFRYSFFSDEDAQPCASPVTACPTCFHGLP